jgi:CPA1 family monovalent cation:H+ antiporter
VADYLEHFWDYMASVANALIFLLVGLTVDLGSLIAALPTLVWVVVAMLVSRALVIYTLVPLSSRLTGSEPVSVAYRTVMFWGGLRGGIALAIALSLPESLAAKEDFVTIATGAVLFTLVVKGLTIEGVVKRFRLHVPPLSDRLARLEGGIAGKIMALDELPVLQAGGLFPLRVADRVRAELGVELESLRAEVGVLRSSELDVDMERRIVHLRCFGTERKLYLEMFRKGHLSEGAYRDLEHSVIVQSDAIRYQGRLPDFTLHSPTGDRVVEALSRLFGGVPGVAGIFERLRQGTAERDYESAWARFHGDAEVLKDLERLATTETHRLEVLDDVTSLYRLWRENARSRLDQTAELFPEFVAATQDRLAGRLALEAERGAIEAQARTGALPNPVAEGLLSELEERLDVLGSARTGKIGADPQELLLKVPFFEGLPREEFARVVDHLRRRTAPRGEAIVRQGERGSSLFLVARGVVRVTRENEGASTDIATLMAGDFFGEMALLHGGVRTATCRAVTPSALYELSRRDIDEVMESCPAMRKALEEADRARRADLLQGGARLEGA